MRDYIRGEEGDEKKEKRTTKIAKREKREREDASSSQAPLMDPLVVLGSDLMVKILEFLGARSVARCIVVSRRWYGIASSDRIWGPRCQELWMGKAHIPRSALVRGASKLQAYSVSTTDAKRTRIMKEDLCDHVWEYRFKETAPEYWRNLDPSWRGTGLPMRRYFHPDGSHTADPDDEVWGGHECAYSIITSYVGDGQIRDHYVRINRWPPMVVTRKSDWRWEMSNHIYCYNSLPDADKEGGTGPLFPVW